jgi:hypothetical protein
MKIRLVGDQLFHAEGRNDGQTATFVNYLHI